MVKRILKRALSSENSEAKAYRRSLLTIQTEERELNFWTRELHVLHARMQTNEASQAVDALFSTTDADLNLTATPAAV